MTRRLLRKIRRWAQTASAWVHRHWEAAWGRFRSEDRFRVQVLTGVVAVAFAVVTVAVVATGRPDDGQAPEGAVATAPAPRPTTATPGGSAPTTEAEPGSETTPEASQAGPPVEEWWASTETPDRPCGGTVIGHAPGYSVELDRAGGLLCPGFSRSYQVTGQLEQIGAELEAVGIEWQRADCSAPSLELQVPPNLMLVAVADDHWLVVSKARVVAELAGEPCSLIFY